MIGYLEKVTRTLVLIIPKVSGYVKKYKVKDKDKDKNKIEDSKKIKLNALSAYDDI